MRSLLKVALAAASLLVGTLPAAAQPLPSAPLPYTQVRPQAGPAAPRPAPPRAAATTPQAPATPPHATLTQPALEAWLDGWMSDAMARQHVAGAAISVVQDGQVLIKKGYGLASLRPARRVDADRTLFRLGSISKTFTWIVLMKQVEAGRIDLNQPINRYLPQRSRLLDDGQSRPVLVRHLLDHSVGFEDSALGHLFERDPGRIRPLDLYLRQERPARVREPGLFSTYSNYGAALAGEAAARASGRGFERLVEEQVLLPLAMRRTTFREPRPERRGLPGSMPAALRGDLSRGFRWTDLGFVPREYEYLGHIAPAGSASSTAGDMARYMNLLLAGGASGETTIYGPATARAFRTPLQRTPEGFNGWAHGFQIFDLPGGRRGYGHLGQTIAFNSSMVLVPELGLGLFVTTNSDGGEGLVRDLPAALVRQFHGPQETYPRPGSPALARQAGAFEGAFMTTRRAYSGLEGFVGLLNGGMDVAVTWGGRLVTTAGGQTRTWVPVGPVEQGLFVATRGEERLVFRMAGGRAVSLRSSANTERWERAATWMRAPLLTALAAMTLAAAVATLVGLAFRDRRDFRENAMQSHAGLVQNIQAGLWIAATALFGLWLARAADPGEAVFGWPDPRLVSASACALVAAVLTIPTLMALPAVWRGGRRVDSWSGLRKSAFTATVLLYATFAVVLGMWGALSPWKA